jgi:hypothetical protein
LYIHLKEIEPQFILRPKIPGTNTPSLPPVILVELPPIQGSPLPTTDEPKPTPKATDLTRRNPSLERRIARYKSRLMIDLGKQRLTDEDMRIVAREAIVEKRCRKLYLPSNEITSDGMLAIAEAMRDSTTLEELDFSNNRLTDKDLLPLAKELSANEKTSVEQWKCCGIAKMKVKGISLVNIGRTHL